MYIREKKLDLQRNRQEWFAQTRLLMHEFEHTAQYKRLGYGRLAFSRRYLYEWCRVGMDYKQNPMEVAAYQKEDDADKLLLQKHGRILFYQWKGRKLSETLGYPTETSYREIISDNPNGRDPAFLRLKFQKGSLQVESTGFCHKIKLDGQSWANWECHFGDIPLDPFPRSDLRG
jgi:hypothetical protein